ncbi:hypothetical protein K503DRAFT_860127 [Rhizopogon vinicolor AM-OR11-026]|uniref:Uncharacterized protein n=1 Tax=Rhizopogon vinicolor AM-OR11-026 TaxID=1314800 RepID=A0A1B7MJQ8_9AGAM|nr:hypothetical protein K503DRAFT_860127 [Rhizopogon vinicolor AM-OR11-026]
MIKEKADKSFPARRTFECDIPPHVVARLFTCSGPEVEVELDIEPSALLHATTAPEDKEDPDITTVHTVQLVLKIAQENIARKQAPTSHQEKPLGSIAYYSTIEFYIVAKATSVNPKMVPLRLIFLYTSISLRGMFCWGFPIILWGKG